LVAGKKRKRKTSNLKEYPSVTRAVAVRFNENMRLPYQNLYAQDFRQIGLSRFALLFQEFPGISVEPMITSLPPEEIQKLSTRIKHNRGSIDQELPGDPISVLLHYYRIIVPDGLDIQLLLKTVESIDYVSAYVEAGAGPPPTPNPRAINQGYQGPSHDGINARYAWNLPGGDGAGVNFLDIEQG
jgi:hypothetical protein